MVIACYNNIAHVTVFLYQINSGLVKISGKNNNIKRLKNVTFPFEYSILRRV